MQRCGQLCVLYPMFPYVRALLGLGPRIPFPPGPDPPWKYRGNRNHHPGGCIIIFCCSFHLWLATTQSFPLFNFNFNFAKTVTGGQGMPPFSMTRASIALLILGGFGGYTFSKVMVIFNLLMWTNHPLLSYNPSSRMGPPAQAARPCLMLKASHLNSSLFKYTNKSFDLPFDIVKDDLVAIATINHGSFRRRWKFVGRNT